MLEEFLFQIKLFFHGRISIFSLIVIGIGLFLIIRGLVDLVKYLKHKKSYFPIEGVVSGYHHTRDGVNGLMATYIVDGVSYTYISSYYSIFMGFKYSVGKKIKLMYNLENPKEAIMLNDRGFIWCWVMGLFWLVMGLFVFR